MIPIKGWKITTEVLFGEQPFDSYRGGRLPQKYCLGSNHLIPIRGWKITAEVLFRDQPNLIYKSGEKWGKTITAEVLFRDQPFDFYRGWKITAEVNIFQCSRNKRDI